MKKLLFIFTIGIFAACGSNSNRNSVTDSVRTNVDSSRSSPDSTGMVKDTTHRIDSIQH